MGCSSSKPKEEGTKSSAKDTGASSSSTSGGSAKADEKLLDKYVLGKVLGQGAFGVVYSCKKKGSREEYAVKMIDQVETPLAEIKHEAEMLKQLAHPCVVKLMDVYYEKVFVCMVLELYKGGDMIEGMQLHWKNKGMLTIPVVQNISKMMVQSVDWLHEKNVVHRDLKGDNFLMDRKQIEVPNCRIYLSDFGTVVKVQVNQRLKHKCGTKTYWSPEFYNLDYHLPVDMWGIGVIMFGLVTGRFPFKGEDDCKNKQVKFPQRTGKDGVNFIGATLDRNEQQRLKAVDALKHPFLAQIKSAAQVAEEKAGDKEEGADKNPGISKESGANAGIQDRRRELAERLVEAADPISKQVKTSYDQISGPGFEVNDQMAERKVKFEWWTPAKIAQKSLYDVGAEKNIIKDVESVIANDFSEEGIQQTLKDHGIDIGKFGQGQAKSLKDMIKEIQTGQAVFMLDAAKHKEMVRVVDVVLVRICHGKDANKRWLIKTTETYPDGRSKGDIHQISGTKKFPHESARQTIDRLVQDRLKLEAGAINFDWAKSESFEDDEESASYPGVRTVYRKEIYEGVLTTTDEKVLQRVGISGGNYTQYEASCSKQYKRTFKWLSETECNQHKVVMRAPKKKGDISALVHPPIGFEEEELQKFLQTSGVDLASFGKEGAGGGGGTRTLKEFSEELVKGESQLIRSPNGKITRLVDVVILKVINEKGEVIIEANETVAGNVKTTERLPAVKRRPDENPFWAAKRVLGRVLKISENLVNIKQDECFLIEESKDTPAYPAFQTKYRRLFIPATVLTKQAM